MKRCLKYLLAVPPLLLCAAAVCFSHSNTQGKHLKIPAATESERLSWLASQGLEAERLSSQAVTIPMDFGGTYAAYAALQAAQLLPLTAYAGERAVCTTYEIRESEPLMYAELLTADGILIGAQCYHPEEGVTLTMQGEAVTLPSDPSDD